MTPLESDIKQGLHISYRIDDGWRVSEAAYAIQIIIHHTWSSFLKYSWSDEV